MGFIDFDTHVPRTMQCVKCGEVRKTERFEWSKDFTLAKKYCDVCRECRGPAQEKKTTAMSKRGETIVRQQGQVDKLVMRLQTARNTEAPHISDALAGLFQRFGGLNGFTEFWYQSLHAMNSDPKTQSQLAKQLTAIVKLLSLNDASNGNEMEAVRHMSSDELDRFTREQLTKHTDEDFTYSDPHDDDAHVNVTSMASLDDLKGQEAVDG